MTPSAPESTAALFARVSHLRARVEILMAQSQVQGTSVLASNAAVYAYANAVREHRAAESELAQRETTAALIARRHLALVGVINPRPLARAAFRDADAELSSRRSAGLFLGSLPGLRIYASWREQTWTVDLRLEPGGVAMARADLNGEQERELVEMLETERRAVENLNENTKET